MHYDKYHRVPKCRYDDCRMLLKVKTALSKYNESKKLNVNIDDFVNSHLNTFLHSDTSDSSAVTNVSSAKRAPSAAPSATLSAAPGDEFIDALKSEINLLREQVASVAVAVNAGKARDRKPSNVHTRLSPRVPVNAPPKCLKKVLHKTAKGVIAVRKCPHAQVENFMCADCNFKMTKCNEFAEIEATPTQCTVIIEHSVKNNILGSHRCKNEIVNDDICEKHLAQLQRKESLQPTKRKVYPVQPVQLAQPVRPQRSLQPVRSVQPLRIVNEKKCPQRTQNTHAQNTRKQTHDVPVIAFAEVHGRWSDVAEDELSDD